MTIINATQYLKQLLSSSELNRIGKFTGFCQRLRDIQPARLLPALLSGLGCDKVDGIAGLHRHFNALQLHDTDQIAYKPFHNQLRKQGFPLGRCEQVPDMRSCLSSGAMEQGSS